MGLVEVDNSDELDISEVKFDPASSTDLFGRVFWSNGEVFRGVRASSYNLAENLLSLSPLWEEYGLIQTERTGLKLSDYSLILKHRTIQFRSYCSEWTPNMLRDAALTYLRLQSRLIGDGYLLKDGHPWNIFFDRGRPIYIDFGSITPYRDDLFKKSLTEFFLYFLLPIRLFELSEPEHSYEFLNRKIPNSKEREYLAKALKIDPIKTASFFGPKSVLKRLKRLIEKIQFNNRLVTEWTDYEQKSPDISEPESFLDKQKAVYQTLVEFGKGTILDIGCNKGWFSILAESLGFDVLSIDHDLISLECLYEKVKKDNLNILPLRIDFCFPTKSNGIDNSYPSFLDRAKSDVVLAMSIIHHLAYKRTLTLNKFANRIARLATNLAIVEFIPAEDIYVSKWRQEGMEWYSRQNFITAFGKYFNDFQVLPSSPSPREIFVFRN